MSQSYRGGPKSEEDPRGFHKDRIDTYVEHRNQPQTDDVSHMSTYLHYGHISPIHVALKIQTPTRRTKTSTRTWKS